LALISSKVKSRTSRREVSEIAIVPDSEWRTPTLTVSSARAGETREARARAPTENRLVMRVGDMVGSWVV
jgi:hypothetical protein